MSVERFQQDVQPGPRGTISYLMNTIYGHVRVSGPRVSEYFAVRRDDDGRPRWIMTHLPTGLMVPYATRRVLRRARQVAAILESTGVKWAGRPRLTRAVKEQLKAEMAKIPDTSKPVRGEE